MKESGTASEFEALNLVLDPEIDPFPAGSGQEPWIEDVLHEIVVEFFPIRAKEAPASGIEDRMGGCGVPA